MRLQPIFCSNSIIVSFRGRCEQSLYLRCEERGSAPNPERRRPVHPGSHRADLRTRAQPSGDTVPYKPPTDGRALQRHTWSRCVKFWISNFVIISRSFFEFWKELHVQKVINFLMINFFSWFALTFVTERYSPTLGREVTCADVTDPESGVIQPIIRKCYNLRPNATMEKM